MKKRTGIMSIETKVIVPATLLENHVNNKHHRDEYREEDSKNFFSTEFENINWCSGQLPVDGTMDIHFVTYRKTHLCLSIPVTSGFVVVCTKGKKGGYKLTWSCSLS